MSDSLVLLLIGSVVDCFTKCRRVFALQWVILMASAHSGFPDDVRTHFPLLRLILWTLYFRYVTLMERGYARFHKKKYRQFVCIGVIVDDRHAYPAPGYRCTPLNRKILKNDIILFVNNHC